MRKPSELDVPVYAIAAWAFKPGLECDLAAVLLRQRIDALLLDLAADVKREMGITYDPLKQRPWLDHEDLNQYGTTKR